MADIETQEEQLSVGRIEGGYNDSVYYHQEVRDANEIGPELKAVIAEIAALEKKKNELVSKLMAKARAPYGWNVKLSKVYEYGYIDVTISKEIYRESKPVAAKPPTVRKLTELERLLRLVDAKTLFNSGLLPKEKKEKLLEEYLAANPTNDSEIPF